MGLYSHKYLSHIMFDTQPLDLARYAWHEEILICLLLSYAWGWILNYLGLG